MIVERIMSKLLICVNLLLASVSTQDLRILVLLPQTDGDFKFAFGAEMSGAAVTIAVEDILSCGLLYNQSLHVDYANTKCNPVQGIGITAAKLEERNYTALIGPQCSGVCDVVAKLASYRNTPIFSGVCQSPTMQDKNTFSTSLLYGRKKSTIQFNGRIGSTRILKTLTRFLGSFNMVGRAVVGLMTHHNWRRFGIISEVHQDKVWILSRNGIIEEANNNNITVATSLEVGLGQELTLMEILKEAADISRIIVLAVRGETLRALMLMANKLGYLDGSYFFIDIYYYRAESVFGEFSWKKDDGEDDIAREAYKSLLFISYYTPLTEEYQDFAEKVKIKSTELFNYTHAANSSIPYPAANLYEAMWTLAVSINETLSNGEDITDGRLISRRLWGRSISGTTGVVTLNDNGDREQGYSIFQAQDMNSFQLKLVGYYFSHVGTFQPLENSPIIWPGQGQSPPLDTPLCGFYQELCNKGLTDKERLEITLAVLLGCLGLVISLSALVIWFVTRHMKAKANEMLWRVKLCDVTFTNKSALSGTMSRSVISMRALSSNQSFEQLFTKIGYFKGSLVAVKKYTHVTQSYIGNNMKEYRQLKDLSHPNVCRCLGICIDVPDVFVLTEYCSKGSLEDILENDSISLDLSFRYSLIWDILKGLVFIHSSSSKFHGNLKSVNCLVDGRFVVKLSDLGPRNWIASKVRQDKEFLWTAPEFLRCASDQIPNPVKGDVYSLGIILQEIVCRCGVFYISYDDLTAEEIICKVSEPQGRTLRPSLDDKTCPVQLKKLIESCWDENPELRPPLKQVLDTMTEIAGDKFRSGNIFDNLLARMEQYANNLESLVDERTGKYLQEKRRAEDLLGRLLPASIASEIQEKGVVDPVSFESVTICFTDIVGFTSISASSTPFQIVAMLNDLYSRFDDVIDEFDAYKVETIGDAYMVVSGLPKRNQNHVTVMASLTLALIATARVFRIRHFPEKPLLLRAGLHTGSVVAGVVGLKMPRYCLFGDTVNTASRMESTGEALKIHVSKPTSDVLLKTEKYKLEKRGQVSVKGKGEMTTYWLQGKL